MVPQLILLVIEVFVIAAGLSSSEAEQQPDARAFIFCLFVAEQALLFWGGWYNCFLGGG